MGKLVDSSPVIHPTVGLAFPEVAWNVHSISFLSIDVHRIPIVSHGMQDYENPVAEVQLKATARGYLINSAELD